MTEVCPPLPEVNRAELRTAAQRRALLAAALLSVVAIGLVFPFPLHGRLWSHLFDLAHAPTFFVTFLCLTAFFDPSAVGLPDSYPTLLRMSMVRALVLAVLLNVVGTAGEFLQQFAGRNPAWGDVAANSTGLAAGLFWVLGHSANRSRVRWISGAVLVLGAVSIGPIIGAWDSICHMQSFPVIASFERSRELSMWKTRHASIQSTSDWATDGSRSAMVTLQPGRYPGISLTWLPGDWSGFKTLSFDLRNADTKPLPLALKLNDREHADRDFAHSDRFHRPFTVLAGTTQNISISIAEIREAPDTRRMELDQMDLFELFAVDLGAPVTFYVDNIRLR